jgi:glycosyltransferase involved in cell wall biosynthesis
LNIAIVAPSPVPFVTGGAENIYAGLFRALNDSGSHQGELIKLPTRELGFWSLIDSYYAFASLDLDHFDAVISLKYPAWMVSHPRHIVYMQHKLRGFYDTWNRNGQQSGLPGPEVLAHPAVAALWEYMTRAERQGLPRTEALLHLRLLLDRLRATEGLPDSCCAFPGPLIRRIVHFLDGIALAPGQIHAYHAISTAVAERPGYFPAGVNVGVLHHPSGLIPTPPTEAAGRHVFTVSRLDSAKRIDLLIDGFRRAHTALPLLIAGTGTEEAALRRRAAGDERIRFLGFVDAAHLAQLYADAAMVLFAPKDEDFGLVALEAMASGRPVITTADAGGCTEVITHGVDGLITAPSPAALAAAIDRLDGDPDLAQTLGAAAKMRAAFITWPGLVAGLLASLAPRAAPAVLQGRRPRITVLSTYPVAGAKGGGPLRIFHLHTRLRQWADIEVLVFDSRARQATRRLLAKGLTERVIPAEPYYRGAEAALAAEAGWVPISDSAFPLLWRHAPAFCEAAARACADSHAVILEHPFLLPAVPGSGAHRLIYDAHNMEAALKHQIYPTTRAGRVLLDSVTTIERDACQSADEIWCCTQDDQHLLATTYRVAEGRFVQAANGVDSQRIRFVAPVDRARRRAEYGAGADSPVTAYFIGSWHGPNIDAAERIIACAWYLRDIRFIIAGNVCEALRQRGHILPRNVVLAGVLDETASLAMVTTCDMALNPMRDGGGSNLKIFEYCAAGAPVVTTAMGARGTGLRHGVHVRIAGLDDFEEGIIATWAETLETRGQRSQAARRHVEQHFDWDVIVDGLRHHSPTIGDLASPMRHAVFA